MQGLHLTADLYQCHCDAKWLTDAQQLGAWCLLAVEAAGLQAVNQLFHAYPATGYGAGGVTAILLLVESQLCLRTWPGQRGVTIDVHACNGSANHSARARGLMLALIDQFQPEWTEQRSLDRGDGQA